MRISTLRRSRSLFAVAAATLLSCGTDRDPASLFAPVDVGTLVVDAVLMVNRQLPDLYLTRATAPDAQYNFATAAESGATVKVIRLATGDTIGYGESAVPGVYNPLALSVVQPEEDYALELVTAGGEVMSAQTRTPPSISISEWVLLGPDGSTVLRELRTFAELGPGVYFAPENQLVYSDGLLEGRFARPAVPGFQVGLSSIDLDSGILIDPDFFDEEDFADLNRDGVSPILEATDGTVRLPWLAVAFGGRHVFRTLALDRNAYDLVLSTPPSNGGAIAFGGNVGDNFERPMFHIEGGIGLFGSASADSIGFFVLPAP